MGGRILPLLLDLERVSFLTLHHPKGQYAPCQAVSEALSEMRPQLTQIDTDNKDTLEKAGMTIIQYDNSFFDEVLNLQGVKDLYPRSTATLAVWVPPFRTLWRRPDLE